MIAATNYRDLAAIIPSVLDDFGLTPAQFRVYGRIARRVGKGGICNESAAHMAEHCRMNIKTVRESIKFLEDHQLIAIERRTGKSAKISLTHSNQWIQPQLKTGIPKIDPTQNESDTLPKMSQGGRPKTGIHPTQNESTKEYKEGIPSRNPFKGASQKKSEPIVLPLAEERPLVTLPPMNDELVDPTVGIGREGSPSESVDFTVKGSGCSQNRTRQSKHDLVKAMLEKIGADLDSFCKWRGEQMAKTEFYAGQKVTPAVVLNFYAKKIKDREGREDSILDVQDLVSAHVEAFKANHVKVLPQYSNKARQEQVDELYQIYLVDRKAAYAKARELHLENQLGDKIYREQEL